MIYKKNRFIFCLLFLFFSLSCRIVYSQSCQQIIQNKEQKLISLSDGIQTVLKDNRLIKVNLLDQDIALEDSLLARSALLPQVSLNISKKFYQYKSAAKSGSQIMTTAEKQPLSYGVSVYQTLFDFGKSISQYQAAKEYVVAQKANIESVKRLAILEFVTAYFNLLETDKMVIVAQKEVESLTAYLNDIQHLFEQGVVVKNDLLPAQVRLADAKQKLIVLNNEKSVALALLNNILNYPLRQDIEVKDILMPPQSLPDMETAWSNSQSQRAEIKFFEEQIKTSKFNERAKAVANFPVFFADGGYQYTENQYQQHQNNSFVGVGAKMNLYDGGAARAELLKERAVQKKLNEQKEKLIEDIKFEVENSYLLFKDANEKILVAKDALIQADENVRFFRIKYTEGSATATEVLEAITMQTKAQTNYYSDDYELKRNYAKFMYSMGVDLALVYEMMEKNK